MFAYGVARGGVRGRGYTSPQPIVSAGLPHALNSSQPGIPIARVY